MVRFGPPCPLWRCWELALKHWCREAQHDARGRTRRCRLRTGGTVWGTTGSDYGCGGAARAGWDREMGRQRSGERVVITMFSFLWRSLG